MTIEQQIQERSNGECELCKSTDSLTIYQLAGIEEKQANNAIIVCGKCNAQLEKTEELDSAHWACLNESMWSEVLPVQIASWRMLSRLKSQSWAADALDMMYLDDDTLALAKLSGDHENDGADTFHRDANGTILKNGDSIVLTKSLDVKGSSLNAKMGTAIKNIRLVPDNNEQIEGKIDNQQIVILTKYVRKSS